MAIFHSIGAAAAAGSPSAGKEQEEEEQRGTLTSDLAFRVAVATAEQPPQDWPARARPGGAAAGLSGRRWWRWRRGTRARPRNAPQRRPRRLAPLPSPPPSNRLAYLPQTPPARSGGSVSSILPLCTPPPSPPPNSTHCAPAAARSAARAHTRTFPNIAFISGSRGRGSERARVRATGGRAWGLQLETPLPMSFFPSRPRSSLLARTAPGRSGCVLYPPRLQVFSAPRAPSWRPRNF